MTGLYTAASNDSSEEQPFDQRQQQQPRMEEYLDDGDLPSLTRKSNATPLLHDPKTTTRPLSPPNPAGLTGKTTSEPRREFWGRLEEDAAVVSSFDEDDVEDDMPDDELRNNRRDTRRPKRTYSEEEEYSSIGRRETFEDSEYGEDDPDNHYCDQTLSALVDMCGKGLGIVHTQDSHENIRSARMSAVEGESPEEHTAIEVEFVEPAKGNLSPQRKNAYLTALARKAKLDFNKKKETKIAEDDVAELYSQDEDIYHSFSASEKRKFLKLINSGVPPAQAQHQVLQDRTSTKSSSKKKKSKAVATETPVKSPTKSTEETADGGGRLSFWKKGRSKRGSKKNGLVSPGGEGVDTTHPESESEDSTRFAKSGINYYDGIRREASDEESGDELPTTTPKDRPKRRPKNVAGFAALKDRRAASAPRPRTLATNLSSEDDEDDLQVVTPSPVKTTTNHPGGVAFAALKDRRSKSTPRAMPEVPEERRFDVSSADSADNDDEEAVKTLATPDLATDSSGTRTVEDLLRGSASKESNDTSNSLEKIEQDLLLKPLPRTRPMATPPPSPPAPPGSFNVTKSNKTVSAVKLPPSVGRPRVNQDIAKTVQVDGLDIDTYMNSTDLYSVNRSANNPSDSMSVYTMGTGVTGMTNGTSHTQSSRVYRRGVAKERLAKAKTGEDTSKGKGWHETIRKAAESTNRVWDPKNGWVDYEEPSIEIAEQSFEKLHIDLNKSLGSHNKNVSDELPGQKGKPTPVPFPEEWQKERDEMLEDGGKPLVQKADRGFHQEEKKLETPIPSMHDDQSRILLEEGGDTRGWLESMKAASAALAPEGHTWDPKYGWTKDGEQKKQNPDFIDLTVPATARSLDFAADHQSDSGHMVPNASSAPSSGTQQTLRIRSISAPRPSRESDRKLNQWMAKTGRTPAKAAERSTESSDNAVASVGAERYIQLGENGTVRSHTQTAPQSASKQSQKRLAGNPATASSYISDDDDDSAPLLSASGAFPSVDDRPLSPIVGIVTEKVGAEDMGLFSGEAAKPHEGKASEVNPMEDSSYADTGSMRSSRRGGGPVDTDEVDETWDSDDEQRFSAAWESDSKSAAREASPPRSKLIPKLTMSKRDTSPLSQRARSKSSEIAPEKQLRSTSPQPNATLGVDVPPNSPSVKQMRQQWENRTDKTDSILHDLSTSESHMQDSPPQTKGSPGTAEWKSFLGKKVKAESAAAAAEKTSENAAKARNEPEGRKMKFKQSLQAFEKPGAPTRRYVDDDSDTLFEFSDRRSRARSSAIDTATFQSDLSPIRSRHEDREPSEAYGPEEGDRGNFFKRLAECAAPVMPSGQSNFVPPNLCARADDHNDETSSFLDDLHLDESDDRTHELKARSKSTPKPRTKGYESSSVVSEDFGAKTAYLEALAMKTAVSKPRSSSRKRASGSSVVSATSSAHSEKWKAFLERKRASGRGSSTRASSTTSVSKAAEKYAAEKVEQMMTHMSSRDVSAPRRERERHVEDMLNGGAKKSDTDKAAEDLAAARVEAMMAALSGNTMDEGEI